jgi:hypothetical protein
MTTTNKIYELQNVIQDLEFTTYNEIYILRLVKIQDLYLKSLSKPEKQKVINNLLTGNFDRLFLTQKIAFETALKLTTA